MSDDNEGYDFTDDEGNDYDDKKNDDDKSKCGSRTTLDKPISVLEAKRVHKGSIKVIGKIVTTSEMYVLHIEAAPNPPVDKDARFIQLEDIEKLDENERLDVILYDDMIENVVAGEIVEIEGEIRLENKNNKNSNKLTVVVHAKSISYVNRKDLVITKEHIESFEKFAKLDCDKDNCQYNLLNRLIAMFAPDVIGHDDVKLGLLRSIVGGDSHGEPENGFIDTFMVGDAEMQRVIEKIVNKISRQKYVLELDAKKSINMDETELKKYVNLVIREVRKDIPT